MMMSMAVRDVNSCCCKQNCGPLDFMLLHVERVSGRRRRLSCLRIGIMR